jgi:PadR family transcriptional regulator
VPGSRTRPLSPSSVAVLRALSEDVTYGFDVMDHTGLPSGTVYPILARMERRGLVASSWEEPRLHRDSGRPARKYYRLTRAGRTALEDAMARYRSLGTLRPGEA